MAQSWVLFLLMPVVGVLPHSLVLIIRIRPSRKRS
jgi:hypothetical protein